MRPGGVARTRAGGANRIPGPKPWPGLRGTLRRRPPMHSGQRLSQLLRPPALNARLRRPRNPGGAGRQCRQRKHRRPWAWRLPYLRRRPCRHPKLLPLPVRHRLRAGLRQPRRLLGARTLCSLLPRQPMPRWPMPRWPTPRWPMRWRHKTLVCRRNCRCVLCRPRTRVVGEPPKRGRKKALARHESPRIAVQESPSNCRQPSLSLVRVLRKM